MFLTVLGAVLPWLLVALGCWLFYQLLRQNGRILLQLEALQELLAQRAATPAAPAPQGLDPGSMAPDFELPNLDGELVKLSHWRGRRVLLVFFNPQCSFCMQMADGLASLKTDGSDGQPVPVLVTSGDPQVNRRFMEQYGIRCPVLVQKKDELLSMYRAGGTPMGYLLDEDGAIAAPLTVGGDNLLALAGVQVPSAPQAGKAGRRGKANRGLHTSRLNARRPQGGNPRTVVPPAASGQRRDVPGGVPRTAGAVGLLRPRLRSVRGAGPRAWSSSIAAPPASRC